LLRSTGFRSALYPLDHARATPQTAHSSRAAKGINRNSAGFRLRLGGGVALRLRSSRHYVCAALSPLADRRPKPLKKNLTMLLY
jgi:hypothetical protein